MIHQVVNIGYYAVVFIFTFVMFIATLRQIVLLKPAEKKPKDSSSFRTNFFSILGLFLLFGITWAFAFFSYGPMLTPSYYIFTILNSFQGRLLNITKPFELQTFCKYTFPMIVTTLRLFFQVSSLPSTISDPVRLLEKTEAPRLQQTP